LKPGPVLTSFLRPTQHYWFIPSLTWEGDFWGDGAVVGAAGSRGQNRKKLFLIVNRKEERKKERKEGRKEGREEKCK
jgi:hypothetical protein